LVLICFALLPRAQGQLTPEPDGQYMNDNTAEGGFTALFHLSTGAHNTALGVNAMFLNNTGGNNTAVGDSALKRNTSGNNNTATGIQALFNNTTASNNTADGNVALWSNTTGTENTATGTGALFSNTTARGNTADGFFALNSNNSDFNTAVGFQALFANFSGLENTAVGDQALLHNTGGFFNVAVGGAALLSNMTGNDNVACGGGALNDTTGDDNTALGFQAGIFATTGSNNVYIGSGVSGVAGESNACYIASIFGRTSVNGTPVLINSNNKLGTATSSKRFKDAIKPMDKASETIFALKPVTFRYKKNLDPEGTPQFGLVAEDVQNVSPALVVRDKEGKPYTVRYDQVNAMLLNEFLKEHKTVQEQGATIARLQKQIEALTAGLQKVSAEVELQKPSAQTVVNNQ